MKKLYSAKSGYDRSAIMAYAWLTIDNHYGPRRGTCRIDNWRKDAGAVLRYGLTRAWDEAKRQKQEADYISAIPVEEKQARIEELHEAIDLLKYLPLGMNLPSRRIKLQAEINRLAA